MTQASAGHGSKRPRREEAAISALLVCPTLDAAAAQAGISMSGLRSWLRDPAFQARYRDARRQVVEQAVSALQRAAGAAVETLERNLTCGTPSAEIAAARAILDQAMRGLELIDLAERIEQLETAQPRADRDGYRMIVESPNGSVTGPHPDTSPPGSRASVRVEG